ncbi:hypothetical protein PLICRDRAFT_38634 [Plicaturopsis crispa FD-325 SS-3]|nr:hypothetical protein PLICRDRAFT_38634 [Plicaturopsis crispa FD-325 SS-3]
MSCFHRLPDELVLKIFQIAAASSVQTCLELTLVASWVRDLVAVPYLVETVTFRRRETAVGFMNFLSRGPQYARYVHNICLPSLVDDPFSSNELFMLIKQCPNLTNVAMHLRWFTYRCINQLYRQFDPLPPSRELWITVPSVESPAAAPGNDTDFIHHTLGAIYYYYGSRSNFSADAHPALSCVTRLNVTGCPPPWSETRYGINPFSPFGRLTHLRIAFQGVSSSGTLRTAVTTILSQNEKLEVLILVLPVDKERYRSDDEFANWFWALRAVDGRFYVTHAQNTFKEWTCTARRRGSVWDDAMRETEEWRLLRLSLT